MKTLAQMLEDYRNDERGLPSYEELCGLASVRDSVLEEAAQLCDEQHDTWRWDDEPDSASGPRSCAEAIRSAINKEYS